MLSGNTSCHMGHTPYGPRRTFNIEKKKRKKKIENQKIENRKSIIENQKKCPEGSPSQQQ